MMSEFRNYFIFVIKNNTLLLLLRIWKYIDTVVSSVVVVTNKFLCRCDDEQTDSSVGYSMVAGICERHAFIIGLDSIIP